MDDTEVHPLKSGRVMSANANTPTSFRVVHPPPVQSDAKRGFLSKPMRVGSASTRWWKLDDADPQKGSGASTSGTAAEGPSVSAATPRGQRSSSIPKPPSSSARRPHSAATLVRLQDNPRAVIDSCLPHLAGASTATVLRELEDERMHAEDTGDLLLAQERADMVRAFAEFAGKAVEKTITSSIEHTPTVALKASEYRTLSFEFTKMWEQQFKEYDEKAEAAIFQLQNEQQRRFEEVENLIRSELATKRPHYSRKVITKREELERLISLRQYKEAERIRRDLAPLEEADEFRFEEALNVTLAAKTKTLRRAQATKMEALKMRIAQGREELMLQRRNDYFNLLLKHANTIEETQTTIRRQAASEKKALHKQLNAMLVRSATKPVHFEALLAIDA